MEIDDMWDDEEDRGRRVIEEVGHENRGIWVVLDEDAYPIYCAGWPEACHEHINEAINEHDIGGAAKWKVRRAELVPNSALTGAEGVRVEGTVMQQTEE